MRMSPSCGCCGVVGSCDRCQLGTAPNELQIDITGVTGDAAECGWNGTYIITYVATNCTWTGNGWVNDATHSTSVTAVLGFSGGNYILSVSLVQDHWNGASWSPDIVASYTYNFGASKPDCSSWSGLALTLNSWVDGTYIADCDETGAAVTVTSL